MWDTSIFDLLNVVVALSLFQVDHVAGTSITHGDILATVGCIANLLQDRGMQYKDHVAVCCYNHLYYFPLTLGIIAAGGIPAFCNPGYVGTGPILQTQFSFNCRE